MNKRYPSKIKKTPFYSLCPNVAISTAPLYSKLYFIASYSSSQLPKDSWACFHSLDVTLLGAIILATYLSGEVLSRPNETLISKARLLVLLVTP